MSSDNSDIRRRLSFARIDANAQRDIRDLWPLIKPALPALLNQFYSHLAKSPAMSEMIGTRQSSLEVSQSKHWERLFSGTFDDAYVTSIRRIGRAHARIGLEPSWYIAGYQFVLGELTRHLISKYRFRSSALGNAIGALNKAVLLDLDLALSTYSDILIEEREARTQAINSAIERFESKVNVVLTNVAEVSARMAETASGLTKRSQSASEEAIAAAAAAEQTSATSQTVAAATEELSSSIQEISRQVNGTNTVVNTTAELTDLSAEQIAKLSSAADRIVSVVDLIQDIAAQTNLLALNATIEAARAGEMGRGFAVVANEVKALASQTAKATEEIAEQVQAIQSSTQSSVESISSIRSAMKDVQESTSSIASAVEEQGAATQEISSNVEMASQAATALSSNVGQVRGAIGHAREASDLVLTTVEDLNEAAGQLSAEIRAFFDELRADEQKDASTSKAG